MRLSCGCSRLGSRGQHIVETITQENHDRKKDVQDFSRSRWFTAPCWGTLETRFDMRTKALKDNDYHGVMPNCEAHAPRLKRQPRPSGVDIRCLKTGAHDTS